MNYFPPKLPSRIPSLDGLRGISISLVVIGHVVGTSGFPVKLDFLSHLGNIGVRFFFVISGFLITTLLLREAHAKGRISIWGFYLRRALRIFPACYFFILVMLVAWQFNWIELRNGDFLHAISYTMNYHHDRSWYLNHLWSLSVEEQFYLFWPGVLVIAGLRKSVHWACLVVVVAPLVRWWMWAHGAPASALTREFQAVADSLAVGCLLSVTFNWMKANQIISNLLSSSYFVLIPVFGVACSVAFGITSYYIWGQSIANFAIAAGILWTIESHGTSFGKILNSPAAVWSGTLSYSLYLWQEPFLNPEVQNWTTTFPTNLALTFIAALFSYWFVERPFLRLKRP